MIRDVTRRTDHGEGTGKIHDHAPFPRRNHQFGRVARHPECAGEIHAQHPVELLVRRLQQRLVELPCRVVDQNVGRSETGRRRIERLSRLRRIPDVAAEKRGVVSVVPKPGGGRFALFGVEVQNGDPRSLGREQFADGAADPLGASGHDCRLVLKFHRFFLRLYIDFQQ